MGDKVPEDKNDFILSLDSVSPKVGTELSGKALWSILSSLALILLYISIRFEFKFALGAILALVHDITITLGIFSLTGYEVTLSTVAAFLTIVGYSLNDTIVILDRIRENMKSSGTVLLESTINKSINQSLSRTLITSMTTLLVITVLLMYGGATIRPFAFTLLVGVIIGTYSSIYVASTFLTTLYKSNYLSGLLFFLIIFFRKESIPFNKQAIKLYLSFGLLNFALSYGITYWATQYVYSSISSILWGLFPLFTSVMAHFMLSGDDNEKLTSNKLKALFLGFIGMVFIGSNQSIDLQSQSFLAIMVLVGAIIIAAWPSVLYKKYNDVVGPYQMNAVCQVLTGVIMLSLSSLLKEDLAKIVWTDQLLFASAYLVLFGGVISWGIYFWLYKYLSVTQVTYVAIFPPIVAIILGWIFLNEVLSAKEIIGTIFILGSSVLIYRK